MPDQRKVTKEQKLVMLNKWRHRCELLANRGVAPDPEICRICNEVAEEIVKDIEKEVRE